MEHLILGRRLERRSLCAEIDALDHADAFLLSHLMGQRQQFAVVSLRHIGKTRTGGEVGAVQRVLGEEVDMVADEHDVADAEVGVHAAGGVADTEHADAQFVHHALRIGHLLHGVALVVVEATLHGQHLLVSQASEEQTPLMALHGRDGEVGNGSIGNGVNNFYLFGQTAQTCAQDDGHLGAQSGVRFQPFSGFFDFL